MTSDFDPISPEVNHSSPGKMLRDARERMGLTQEEVAKELYMTLTKVRSIESEDYNRLHSDTFIRGYLRAYGQLVKVDLQELLVVYDNQAKRLGLKEEFIPPKAESPNRKIWQFGVVLVGLLLLIWLLSVWFLDNRQKTDYSTVALAGEINGPDDNPTVEPVISTEIMQANNLAAVADSSDSSISASSVLSAANQVATTSHIDTAKTDKLEFFFRDECWLEVSDAKGDVLATDLQLKNTRLVLEGVSPFDIKMGNAPGVSLKLNDEDVNLVPALGTNVLSIKLGPNSGQ